MPAPPPGRRGVGMPAPGHVVHRDDEPARAAPAQHRRGEGHRMHDVEAARRPQPAPVPRPRHERSGEVRRNDRLAELGQGVRLGSASTAGRPAGQEGQRDVPSDGRLRLESGQQPPGVRPDAAGYPAPQLLDGHEDRTRRAQASRRASRYSCSSSAPQRRPGEATDPGVAGGDEAGPQLLVFEAAVEGRGQAVLILRFDQQGAVTEDLGKRAHRGGHDGDAGLHGLEGRESEPLVARGVGQHVRTAQQRGQFERFDPPRAGDALPGPATRPARPRSSSSPHPAGPARTRATSRWRVRHRGKGAHETGQVLARLRRPDGQDVARRRRRGAGASRSAAASSSARAGRSGTPGATVRTRSGSAPKASTTSPATNSESVCTHAPRARARRIRPG